MSAELGSLQCIAALPELLDKCDLRPVHFADQAMRAAFCAASALHKKGQPVSAGLIAREAGRLDLVDLLTSGSVYGHEAEKLADCSKTILADFDNSAPGRLLKKLSERRFNPEVQPPSKRVVYYANGVAICTEGNLTVISALPGAGKSSLNAAFMAAAMVPEDGEADTLGISGRNTDAGLLLHFDTEQDPNDHWQLANKAMRQARIKDMPDWLHSYSIADLKRSERRAALLAMLETYGDKYVRAVLIDGGADLIESVNDELGAIAFVEELHQLAIRFRAPFIIVLHINKGQNAKTRGHFGSELSRKCETELLLTQKGEVTTITQTKSRRRPITPYGFKWSDSAGMHVLCEPPRDPELIKLARTVYDGDAELGQNEFCRRALEFDLVHSDGTARNRWREMRATAIVTATSGGKYALSI